MIAAHTPSPHASVLDGRMDTDPRSPLVLNPHVTVIGAGLAGSEAAWQLAQRGVAVTLFEMRPAVTGPAHHSADFAELVCSNSFKSDDPGTAAGLLKRELERLGSLIVRIARESSVPAGGALAVDRALFARRVTEAVEGHPSIEVRRAEVTRLPDGPAIVATGPLTSPALEEDLRTELGLEHLAFFDAAAPIVEAESVDTGIAFRASRYDKGEGADYLNCPMDRSAYDAFVDALLSAERVRRRDFETGDLFQACQPIEEVARRGRDAPRFGALKPVGLTDPRTGRRPWAVVQLRPENRQGTALNLVGFQTNLTFAEQRRVFCLVPGLEGAEFLRYGVMHRNTFVDAPRLLTPGLAVHCRPGVHVAGQLAGTEGYAEAAATDLLAALDVAARLRDGAPVVLPSTTALGALVAYATDPATERYQPMHVNFGLMPPLDPPVRQRAARNAAHAARALADLDAYLAGRPDLAPTPDAEATRA